MNQHLQLDPLTSKIAKLDQHADKSSITKSSYNSNIFQVTMGRQATPDLLIVRVTSWKINAIRVTLEQLP